MEVIVGSSFPVEHICNHHVDGKDKAHNELTGNKPAEFYHARGPVRYDDDVESLQTKLQYTWLIEFDQNLGGLRPPSLYEAHVPGDTTVSLHVEAQNKMEMKLYMVSRTHSSIIIVKSNHRSMKNFIFSYNLFRMKYETQKSHFSYENFILTTLLPCKIKSRLVIIEYAGYIFWQLFLRWL